MGLTPSAWAQQIKPSPTLEIKSIADRLRLDGKQIFDFGIGEMNPELPVPHLLKAAISQALMDDATHYSPEAGDPELLEAIHADLRLFGLSYSPSEIVSLPWSQRCCLQNLCNDAEPDFSSKSISHVCPNLRIFREPANPVDR